VQILGAICLEEKLQEKTKECIKSFKKAKIKTWILTSDKIENSLHVAYNTKILSKNIP
jgi:P-type E1-E2 ATPase